MKKTFTFFASSALFLMLLFPVSVKADTTLSFVYSSTGQDTHCDGSNTYSDKGIKDSDFRWSDNNKDNVKNVDVNGDKWTGVKSDYTACSRNTYSFDGSSCTLNLLINQLWDDVERSLPSITINGNTYYAAQATWGESNSETIVDNKFNFTYSRSTRNTPVTFVYNNVNPGTGDFDISVYFPSGDADKFLVKTLTITQNAATYAVTATASNGSVSGTGSYAEGAEVTLTASPNENYSFTGWSSSDINIAVASANPLVFTMPGNAVSVTANFAECTKHIVTLAANNNEYGSVSGGGEQCDGSVTVTATPYTDYRFVNWTNTSTSEVVSTDAEYTFPLSADISLTANFELDPCTNSKTIQCESNYVVVTVHSNADKAATPDVQDGYVQTVDQDDWYAYYYPVTISSDLSSFNFNVQLARSSDNNSYINIFKKTNEGSGNVEYAGAYYNKLGWKKLATGSWKDDWFTVDVASFDDSGSGFSTLSAGEYLVALSGKFRVKLDYFTLTASENIFCPNTITMAKSEGGSANPTATVEEVSVTTAFEGAVVRVTAAAASAGYNFSGWTASPSSVEFANAKAPITTFVMPAEDVTITANYGEVVSSKFTYTTSGSGSITCLTASDASVASGTEISMTAVPSGDYVFTGWSTTAGTFSNPYALTTTFTMPAEAATVTATFAQVDNKIIIGDVASTEGFDGDGNGTMNITTEADFDAFGHNVLKFAYSDMDDGKYKGRKIRINDGYSPASSAGATGFGFYYKTEKADDNVAFCFEVSSGEQVKWELQATNNEWKYFYFPHAGANSWNGGHIVIFMNGDDTGNYSTWDKQGTHTTYKNGGAFYMSEIAATSITSKPDIDTYTYTRELSADYGTLCLPMDGSVSGATLYSVAGKQEEGGKLYIVLEEQGATLAAGEPYIFETDGSTLTATMSGAHSAVNEEANGLVGTYQQITAPAYSEPDNLNYVLALDNSNNTVFKRVGADVTVGAYRAYINIENVVDYSPASAAPGRKYIRFGIEGTEEEQAVEMIYDDASLRTRKIMQNGHLYILRDGHLFTAQGTQIK